MMGDCDDVGRAGPDKYDAVAQGSGFWAPEW